MKRNVGKTLAASFALASVLVGTGLATAPAYAEPVNLALGKTIQASKDYYHENGRRLTDGKKTNPKTDRWMTEAPKSETHWALLDLGKTTTVDHFVATWENAQNSAKSFKIYVSDNKDSMGDPVYQTTDNKNAVSDIKLQTPASGRYVKLEVNETNGAYGVSCMELEAYNGDAPVGGQQEGVNVASKRPVTASASYHNTASRLTDGNMDKDDGRWMTEKAPTQWAVIDLGAVKDLDSFRITWENAQNHASDFNIYVSETESNGGAKSWGQPVKAIKGNKDAVSNIKLETTARGRYIKLEVTKVEGWNAVSAIEFEACKGDFKAPEKKPADYLNDITVDPVTKDTAKLSYHLPAAPEGYEIKYNGTDYEQVIGADATIFHPIADVTVKASFKIQNKTDKTDYAFREIDVRVPGTMPAPANANPSPQILPELREWVGSTGKFTGAKRVVFADASLQEMAQAFANDFKVITGQQLQVVQGSQASAGDILFKLGADKNKGLGDEGYFLTAETDKIVVSAEQVAGANWGGKTILQGVKQSGDNSFPCGTTRDYPLHRVRGLILDVGRKTFTLDWLKQMTEQMAWFKMNDFQVHLNDNFIGLENCEDPMQAYSGFRLESDVKKGGNNGKNQADLTSTDVWYTKEGFKEFIEHSKALGVNIIPEIDTPAHSLALTKVRPDLRSGTSGRQNDHLDLKNQYNESIGFVQDIFGEYMDADKNGTTDASDVFGASDVIHIGADEYNADGNAFRRFNNDMFDYVEDHGKTARVWGSLTSIKGDGTVAVPGVDPETGKRRQIDLWNAGWAHMDKMYEDGFDLIDCNDGDFYIVPNAGYYYDYLGDGNCYNNNLAGVGKFTLPAGDPQVAGGAFAVWNDMCYKSENGMSEYDIYKRIQNSMGLFAANGWGKGGLTVEQAKQRSNSLGDDPTTNFGYKAAADEDGRYSQYNMDDLKDAAGGDADLVDVKDAKIEKVDHKSALKLNGGASYATVEEGAPTTLGLDNSLRVKVKRTTASNDEQILFESEYGTIKAVQKETGKVGFTRENRDYSFNYTLPVNEWVELEFKNRFEFVDLYVNGSLVDSVGSSKRKDVKATAMFPVQTVGSKTHAFQGYVDDIRISASAGEGASATTMALDYAVMKACAVLENQQIAGMDELIAQARELMNSANPSQADIDALTAKINALLVGEDGKPNYEVADYCRIDAYKQILGNEVVNAYFTPASLKAVKAAADAVRTDLPASMQDTVNGYELGIERALDSLVPLNGADLNFIPQDQLSATASSFQKDGSDPKNVLDGNPNTIWHSDWNIKKDGHWLNIASAEGMSVNGIVYTPRPEGTNGNIEKYKVEVSFDGKTYKKVKEGELKVNGTTPMTIEFDRQDNVKNVKLTWVKGSNKNAAAAEIQLLNAAAAPDYDGLQGVINVAKAVKKDGSCKHDEFTDATWNALQSEIAKAEKTIADKSGDVNSVYAQKQALAVAFEGLRLRSSQMEEIAPGAPVEPGKPDPEQPNPEQPEPEDHSVPMTPLGPSTPVKPEDNSGSNKPGKGDTLVQTGDNNLLMIGGVAFVAVAAIGGGVIIRKKAQR